MESLLIITAFQPRLTSPHAATVPGSGMSHASPFLTQLNTDISLPPADSICTATFVFRSRRELGECFSGINSIHQCSSDFEYINPSCDVSERETAQSYNDLSTCCQNGYWHRNDWMRGVGLLSKCFVETSVTICSKYSHHDKQNAVPQSPLQEQS